MSAPRDVPEFSSSVRRASGSAGLVLFFSFAVASLVGAEKAADEQAAKPKPLEPAPAAVVETPAVTCVTGLTAVASTAQDGAATLEITWDAPAGNMAQIAYSTSPSHIEWIEFTRDVSAHGHQSVVWKLTEFQRRSLGEKAFEVVVYTYYKDADTGASMRAETRAPATFAPSAAQQEAAPAAQAPAAK